MRKIESFQSHLKEMNKDTEFTSGYEEEKKRVGLAIELAELRRKKGLSQTKLAMLSGVTQQQLSRLEKGGNCNINTFLRVCSSLGVDVSLNEHASL
jgi:DNA-binding Xre family transcriptional regulator